MNFFIKKCLSYVIPLLLLVVGVNWGVDPGNIVSGVEAKIASYLVAGHNVTNVFNIDERSLQKYMIMGVKSNPETAILGSSRVMLIGKNFFDEATLSNGVSGASLEDLIAIYQLYRINRVKLKRVVVGIDPWLFNINNAQVRWKTLANEYNSFFTNDKLDQTYSKEKYFQLFSFSYFQESVKFYRKKLNDKTIVVTNTIANEGMTRLPDGTIFYDLKYRTITPDLVLKRANEYIRGNVYSLDQYREISAEIVKKFDFFVSEMIKDGVVVEFLLLPYFPVVYEFLMSSEKYRIIGDVELFVREYAANKKLAIKGSYDPSLFNLEYIDFYDGMHLTPGAIKKIIKSDQH